ncbi:ATP-binding protein [Gehongia tenuis]|uniref:histidine kinase n=1 Tax=Gehongia tenuis TaxID=2763655 RepID=A0A926D3D7_9FIRM|nr:ATP-binding protein [Gehongia tenuis]MBC8530739.1 ATP-binding protein [Gehongia tenuis]
MKDISLHMLDIVENSVRAEAKNIAVEVAEDTRADTLSMTVSDDGKGMSPELVQRVSDPFVTSRTTRKVGLGIPLLRSNAEQSGGYVVLTSKLGEGTRIQAVFGLTNIDRPPLGNIAETMASLILCNPDLEFRYVHRRDGEEIVLDTREMREILGPEVPLSDPSVAEWVRAYLQENIVSLHGGADYEVY